MADFERARRLWTSHEQGRVPLVRPGKEFVRGTGTVAARPRCHGSELGTFELRPAMNRRICRSVWRRPSKSPACEYLVVVAPRLIVRLSGGGGLANADAQSPPCALLCACDTAPAGRLHAQQQRQSIPRCKMGRTAATRGQYVARRHATLDVQPWLAACHCKKRARSRDGGAARQRSTAQRVERPNHSEVPLPFCRLDARVLVGWIVKVPLSLLFDRGPARSIGCFDARPSSLSADPGGEVGGHSRTQRTRRVSCVRRRVSSLR